MSFFCQNNDSASASPVFVSHITVQILLCERTWPRLGHGFGFFGSAWGQNYQVWRWLLGPHPERGCASQESGDCDLSCHSLCGFDVILVLKRKVQMKNIEP